MLHRSAILASILLTTAAAACGGSVVVSPGEGGGVGTTSTTGTGGATTSTSTGTTTVTGTTTGTGGGPACFETHDTFSLELGTWDGHYFACGGESGTFETDAKIADIQGGFIVLDGCPPNAKCMPLMSKLTVAAPGLLLDLGQGTYVHVRVEVQMFQGGCTQKIQITNLPTWGGAPNPVMSAPTLWLLAADGDASAFADSPLIVEPMPLGCYPDAPVGCSPHDDYTLRFRPATGPSAAAVDVAMGATEYWWFSSGEFAQQVGIRNLRSFSLGWCDGPTDQAYWVTHMYGLD